MRHHDHLKAVTVVTAIVNVSLASSTYRAKVFYTQKNQRHWLLLLEQFNLRVVFYLISSLYSYVTRLLLLLRLW